MAEKQEIVCILKESIHEAEKAGRVARVDLLEMLDKSPSTLNLELREWKDADCRNKLGFEDAWKIIKATAAIQVVRFMAAALGFALRNLGDREPDGKDMDEECLQSFQALSALVAAIKRKEPYTELIRLYDIAFKELGDIIRRVRMEQTMIVVPARRKRVV